METTWQRIQRSGQSGFVAGERGGRNDDNDGESNRQIVGGDATTAIDLTESPTAIDLVESPTTERTGTFFAKCPGETEKSLDIESDRDALFTAERLGNKKSWPTTEKDNDEESESEETDDLPGVAECSREIDFTVSGDPVALQRAQARYRQRPKLTIWDPNKKNKRMFREQMITKVFGRNKYLEYKADPRRWKPVFHRHVPIQIKVVFKTRPPNCHFVNNRREQKRLRKCSSNKWSAVKDLDNLDKFLLDCMQGVIMENDVQVVSQEMSKQLHHEGDFEGETVVNVKPFLK